MSAEAKQLGALIPDAVPPQRESLPVDLSARAKKARWLPKSHSAAECEEARRVLAHWNDTFRGVEGSTIAQVNNLSNVRHYVRTLRRCRQEGDIFAHITEQHVLAAIDAYRADSYNVRASRWKCFRDWLDPETILKYAGQGNVAAHRAEQPCREQKRMDHLTAAAHRVLQHDGLYDFVSRAQASKITLAKLFKQTWPPGSKSEAFVLRLRELFDRRAGLSAPDRETLSNRARKCFEAYFHRPFGRDVRNDPARLDAIELALLDLDAKRAGSAPSVEPVSRPVINPEAAHG